METNKSYLRTSSIRTLVLTFLVLFPIHVFADFKPQSGDIGGEGTGGWTPSDAGLVVQLNPNDQFRLSTVIDGVEYFVCDYSGYTGGKFNYSSGNFLKLIPRTANGMPPGGSLWTVGEPLKSKYNGVEYDLVKGIDGIIYTMSSSKDGQTLKTNNDNFTFVGELTTNKNSDYACNVAFAIPTVRSRINMDPKPTMTDRTYPFDGQMGEDEKGEVWREVYWFHKSRVNGPFSYAATGLTAFETRSGQSNYGRAYQINGKTGGRDKKRMLFRLYIVQEHPFETCPNSYFFAHDEQNYLKFLKFNDKTPTNTDSTAIRKIYTHDHHHCMERIGDSKYYQSGWYKIPESDSVFYYIGKKNKFYSSLIDNPPSLGPTAGAFSAFTNIRQLRISQLANESTPYIAPIGATGRIVVDTTSGATNLGASFEPAGYFFHTNSGKNVKMTQVDDSTWITDEMWTIAGEYMLLEGEVLLYTGQEFSSSDPGVAIAGWTEMQAAPTIPVYGHPGWTASGKSGWARIHTNRGAPNGGIEFVIADTEKCLIYDNNGSLGAQVPNQYLVENSTTTKVAVREARLNQGFTFLRWTTNPDGTGTSYNPGDSITLSADTTRLYAQATYDGTYNVALSFKHSNGKRYFVTNPTMQSPTYLRARTYTDWTNVWQGMADQFNTDPNYLSTYMPIGLPICKECAATEYVLDPHSHTIRGFEDSLVLYENHVLEDSTYVGLYYEPGLNTFLANNSWAGLIQSSEGWPTFSNQTIDSTKLFSTHYLHDGVVDERDTIIRTARDLPPYIQYKENLNQFDGVEGETNGTTFQISNLTVAASHYVILPDTTDAETPWTEAITFGFHEDEQTTEDVWSKLIGKQLMAAMFLDDDTIYFHPNNAKTKTTAPDLRLSLDYRLTHAFEYKRDARVEALGEEVTLEDKPTYAETDNEYHCTITSGENSPLEVKSNGSYIDIVDTLRVWLRPTRSSRIKDYYGRWKTGAEGVHVLPDGSRYRDILVTTKTYHYGPTQTEYRLVPDQESYNFGSLDGVSGTVNFSLQSITSHQLLDKDGNFIREEIISTDTIEDKLDLTSATFSLKEGDTYFTIGTKTATSVQLTTQEENTTAQNRDTLTVTTTVTISGSSIELTAKVPLLQVSTIGTELIWSVDYNGTRYFIFATSTGLRYQTFSTASQRLVRSNNELIKGAGNADNSDQQYITPWSWTDVTSDQLTLKTEYGVNRYFHISSGGVPGVDAAVGNASTLRFEFANTYTNDNGNYEEIVYLQYGADRWLQFNGSALVLVESKAEASLFSWAYMLPEYYMLNNGAYPSKTQEEFGYNSSRTGSVQTRYQAYLDHSMLLNNTLLHLCKTEEKDIADLINKDQEWKTSFANSIIHDSRVATSSGLSIALDTATLTTTITQAGTSPMNVTYNGQYVNIVDTLDFRINLQDGAPDYRFKDWAGVSTLEDAHVKVPLIRRTYHEVSFDSIACLVPHNEFNHAFPATLRPGVSSDSIYVFDLRTERHIGRNVYNVNNQKVSAIIDEVADSTNAMDLTDVRMAELRMIDEYGNKPTWCRIIAKGKHSITVKCFSNGIRSPRVAYIYLAYIVMVDDDDNPSTPDVMKFVNYRLTVSQASLFEYANNQTLYHSAGASGDPKMDDGRQQAHENKRILYYYNPAPYNEPDQHVELPVRERGFYGWWRWYREGLDQNGVDVSDSDIPDSVWYQVPRNVSDNNNYKYPFRIIGDSVWVDDADPSKGKKLVTMGRYTVFHYKAKDYNNKKNPACKVPLVYPPHNKTTVTYVVDISNYYDNLPLSTEEDLKNQIDTAMLDTLEDIIEPTLSLREVFELHPWTEMAARMESYKTAFAGPFTNDSYMEDHVVMAPIGAPLLLSTEQRYDTAHLYANKHSESLLGYYMRDDNWDDFTDVQKDTMIWCGGWDADCKWYTYNPTSHTYTLCTHPVNEEEDFLEVPIKGGLAGDATDTVYYCLRARSKATTDIGTVNEETVDGDYWFNICRYKIMYHDPNKYGPKLENKTSKKAIITNDEIEQDYEVLERLNFDYNKPGTSYQIYPHPLPWKDGSYGYTYPLTSSALPNRYHDETDFPGPGEYGIINKIPYSKWWRKIEQHGGAANGYMLYCDGMSAAGQVAALTLQTELCEGQKLYFSGYVSNASSQTGKSNPNFTFSVQGSNDGTTWEDISSYMTGDIVQADEKNYTNWHQIFFPIEHEQAYTHFRVKIFNMAADVDGNDFIIDDMCVFATKPPLIAYQANTRCVEKDDRDSVIHVVLRVDYQGFTDLNLNNADVNYTVEQETKAGVKSFVPLMDGYIDPHTGTNDTIYGAIHMPAHDYEPSDNDSIFANLNLLAERFEQTYDAWELWKNNGEVGVEPALFRKGYIYENLDGDVRPVLYVIHSAKMTSDNKYTVRMSLGTKGLMDAQCAMTSELKVTNRMMLMLNGIEQDDKEVSDICGNVTHDLSLRVRGTLIQDSVAPIDLTGSCVNDWLLYGDTVEESSYERYGYYYSDIVKVVKDILRVVPISGTNANQFVHNLGEVNRNVMKNMQGTITFTTPGHTTDHPYDILASLVNNGFLTLYQSNLTVAMNPGDSMQYVIFPILGSGTDDLHDQSMEVCPTPLVIKLKTKENINGSPMIIGGLHRDSTQMNNPIIVLADAASISSGVHIPVDSIRNLLGINQIEIVSSNDPNFSLGVHKLEMTPDKIWSGDPTDYYHKGDTMVLAPSSTNTYQMRPGYTYTFEIEMVSSTGDPTDELIGCPYGKVPFTIAYVPDYLRWNPKNAENAQWNNPENWLGVTAKNGQIHADAHFVPLPSTKVIIPSNAKIYPSLPATISSKDSVQQVGFSYNICDAIRVMPNAIIGNQQYLSFDKVIVDMSIPQQKWAFRSAPVTGMVGGDLFMADADLASNSNLWEAGEFDTGGRTYTTGNASFWLSVYDQSSIHANGTGGEEVRDAAAEWSKVTNYLAQSLPPAQGWAVYTRTKSGKAATVRLPKNDDVYHYYSYGNIIGDEPIDRGENAGKLAFYPGKSADHQDYVLTNAEPSTLFTFGNPTMAYIDIWGFIHDNGLVGEISYLNKEGTYTVITQSAAEKKSNQLSTLERYLPPMQAIMVKVSNAATSKAITLNTNRIVTSVGQVVRPLSAPMRNAETGISKGIMTITATNPASPLCTSQVLLGQGYHDAIQEGEDAVLTTINIDKFSTSTPTTPFTLYAAENGYGLSIDLRDSIVCVPLSFHMSNLSFAPMTYLWFTGVHAIDGQLVLYDALTDTERPILDGICLEIETPEASHEKRYYIRRKAMSTDDPTGPTTDIQYTEPDGEQAIKIIRNGQVFILRGGHVYTIYGQRVR